MVLYINNKKLSEKFKYLKAKVKIIDDQADLLMYIPKEQLE